MYCLFCNQPEDGNLDEDKEIVCGICVINLSKFSQKEIYAGYILAKKWGMDRKVSALESFLEKETIINGLEDNRLPDRGRGNRVSGLDKKVRANVPNKDSEASLHKSDKNSKDVFRSRSSKLAGSTT